MAGIWRCNHLENIMRSEEEHNRIYAYIESNPIQWKVDKEIINR